ncbi:MAG: Ig-like domain-containing protein [Gaiellaceae bacterium]
MPAEFCTTARQYTQGANPNEHGLQVSLGTRGGPHASFSLKCKKRSLQLSGLAEPATAVVPGDSTVVVSVFEPGSTPAQAAQLPPAKPKPGKKTPPPTSNKAPGSKQAVPGVIVAFTTTFGTLSSATATTNAHGQAVVTLSSSSPGQATVKATIAAKTATSAPAVPISTTVQVQFVNPCKGQPVTLLDDTNTAPVDDGGTPPTFSTHGKSYCLNYIQTYHWNGGRGVPPGTLGLKGGGGAASVRPFKAKASPGQNNAPNVNWYVYPSQTPPTIIDGTYSCTDSGAATWSSNKESGGRGFCIVQGIPTG